MSKCLSILALPQLLGGGRGAGRLRGTGGGGAEAGFGFGWLRGAGGGAEVGFGFGFGWLRGTGAGGAADCFFCMYDGFAGCAAALLAAGAAAGAAAGGGAGFGAEVPLSSSTLLLLPPRLRRSRNTAATAMRPTRSMAPTTERATVAPSGRPRDSEGQCALRPVQLMVTLQTVVRGLNVPVAVSQHTPLVHWSVCFSAFQSVSHDIP